MTDPVPVDLDERQPRSALLDGAHAVCDEQLTDRLLGEAELSVRERVRMVVAREIAPRAAAVDATGSFVHDSYQALVRAGLAGLVFPRDLGGQGQSTLAYAVAMEEIAAGCGATSLVYMTQTHAAYPLLLAGSPEIQRRYIPALCAGKIYGSLAITEPEAGSDVSALRTTARRDGEDYVINGAKTLITTGDRADVVICFATVDRSLGRQGIVAFAVDGASTGLTHGTPLRKMGMHGSPTAELSFDAVRVPASARLGDEGWSLMVRSVVKSRISAAAQGVGLARGAYARLIAWAHTKGEPWQQVFQFGIADVRSRIVQARLLLYATVTGLDRAQSDGGNLVAEIAMTKLVCTDLAVDVTLACSELLGVDGDLADLEVERFARDAKVTQIYDGTNEVQRMLIGRDLMRRVREALG